MKLYPLAGIIIFSAALTPAFSQSCDPRVPGVVCEPLWQQAVGELFDAAHEIGRAYGEDLGKEGKAIAARVQAARTKFAQTNPSSSAFAPAWAELAEALRLKDLWCLKIELLPDEVKKPYGIKLDFDFEKAVDGGIRPYASRFFSFWSAEVKARTGPQLMGIMFDWNRKTPAESVSQALRETVPAYERYRLARDWAEAALARHPFISDPESLVIRFLAIQQPWAPHFDKSDPDLINKAREYYRTMLDVYGRETVLASARRVTRSPIGKDGLLAPALVLHGFERPDPYDAFEELTEEATPRNYIIAVNAGSDYTSTDLRKGEKAYNSMVEVFGEAVVAHAGRRLIDTPKSKDGAIEPELVVNGTEFANQYDLALELMGESSPRNYAILVASAAKYKSLQLRVREQMCRRWEAAYGEAAVAGAAERVRAAPKDENSNLMFPQRLGERWGRTNPYYVFWGVLENNASPKDRLRAVIAFHDKIDSKAALDTAYGRFTAKYPEAAAVKALADIENALAAQPVPSELRDLQSRRMWGGDPGDYYAWVTGIVDGTRKLPSGLSITKATPPPAASDLIDDPLYLDWAKFKPGAAATYAETTWISVGGQLQPAPGADVIIYSYKLKYVDSRDVAVENSQATLTRSGGHAEDARIQTYPARVPKQVLADYLKGETGTDTLEVNGKKYECRWRKVTGTSTPYTVWMNDTVPGGVVLSQMGSGDTIRLRILQPFTLENIYALDGPRRVYGAVRSDAANSPLVSLSQLSSRGSGAPPPAKTPAPAGNLETAQPAALARTVPQPAAARLGHNAPSSQPAWSLAPGGREPPLPVRIAVVAAEPIDLSSDDGTRQFRAQTTAPVKYQNQVLIPAGTDVYLRVRQQGRTGLANRVFITIDTILPDGKPIPVRTNPILRFVRLRQNADSIPRRQPVRRQDSMMGAQTLPAGTPLAFITIPSRAR